MGIYYVFTGFLLKIISVIGKADISSLDKSINLSIFNLDPYHSVIFIEVKDNPGATSSDSVLIPLASWT